jgi:hypothetical protein
MFSDRTARAMKTLAALPDALAEIERALTSGKLPPPRVQQLCRDFIRIYGRANPLVERVRLAFHRHEADLNIPG